jgi:hypothetical protein
MSVAMYKVFSNKGDMMEYMHSIGLKQENVIGIDYNGYTYKLGYWST